MSLQNNYIHAEFGIDEVYILEGFAYELLGKLHQRAILGLDAEDNIVRKHVSYDMVLIFHKRAPNRNLIYRFLESLDRNTGKESYIKENTLLNEEELYATIKSKKFVLITHKILVKEVRFYFCFLKYL